MGDVPICINPVVIQDRQALEKKYSAFVNLDLADKVNALQLHHLELELTNKCGASCAWCYSSSNLSTYPTIPRKKALNVIDQAYDLGVRFVAWSGGDPILHPHWDDLLGYAADKGMRGCFLSSGMLPKAEVRRLLRFQDALDSICVHISTIDQATYDRIHHNPRTLQARFQGYRNLLEAGYPPDRVTNVITLTRASAERIEETIDFFVDEMGSKSICIAVFKGEGFGQTLREWEPSLSETSRAYHYRAQRLGEHWLKLGTIGTSFYYCRTAIAVTGAGDVVPCACCREMVAGSIYQEDLGTIFERRRDFLLFNHPIRGYCGSNECPNRELCFGCRANALRYTGDVTESDPKCFFNPASQEYCLGNH